MALALRLLTGMVAAALAAGAGRGPGGVGRLAGRRGPDAGHVLDAETPDDSVLDRFHPDCRIDLDGVMARRVTLARGGTVPGAPSCRDARHWEGLRRYVGDFTTANDTTARFMRPSGIGAPWMVRYAVRCRRACRGDLPGFEIRFTYDGRRVTRRGASGALGTKEHGRMTGITKHWWVPVALLLLLPSLSASHGMLLRSQPAADSEITRLPETIRLSFSEARGEPLQPGHGAPRAG